MTGTWSIYSGECYRHGRLGDLAAADCAEYVRNACDEITPLMPGPVTLEWLIEDGDGIVHENGDGQGHVVTEEDWRAAMARRKVQAKIEVFANFDDGVVSAWFI